MKSHRLQLLFAAVCCASLFFAAGAKAVPTGQKSPVDIALRDGRVLVGQVVSPHGVVLGKAPVSIQQNGREVIRVVTNADGEFTVAGLKGGEYLVVAPGFHRAVRMWEGRTAPPGASKSLRVTAGDRTVRNLWGDSAEHLASVRSWVAHHPLMTTSILAAISYPLAGAVDASKDRP